MVRKARLFNSFILFGLILIMIFPLSACGNKKYGNFYELIYAYDNGVISKEDLRAIAEKHNNRHYDTMPKKYETKVKKAYAAKFPKKDHSYKDVVIHEYLGEYNGCLAMMIRYRDIQTVEVISTITVDDIVIHYSNGFEIIIYKMN